MSSPRRGSPKVFVGHGGLRTARPTLIQWQWGRGEGEFVSKSELFLPEPLAQSANHLALWTRVSHDDANRSMSFSLKAISADAPITVISTNAAYHFQVSVCVEAVNRGTGSLAKSQDFPR